MTTTPKVTPKVTNSSPKATAKVTGPDQKYIASLADLMESKGINELEWQDGESALRLVRGQMMMQAAPTMMQAAATSAPAPAAKPAVAIGTLPSPMVGTVYLSPQPGAAKFAEVGKPVKEGQTLLIIEAMKVMNQIHAPKSGTLVSYLVEDGQPVEYAQPLLVIE